LRRLAVHVIGSRPELFPGCEHALATAESDPDEGVRSTAWLFSRHLDSTVPADEQEQDPPAEREPTVEELLERMRGEGPWTPIDVALLAEAGAIDAAAAKLALGRIAADEGLDPFDHWCAARARRGRGVSGS
jgi:hypothetical protein